ncbi:unnamed protein product [Symbiodinium sp. CCMP2592]|nr:unnamed protein product [Symbiodinium sp. CCMP2592]
MRSVDDFFASLPAEEFEDYEAELREVLINAAAKAKDLDLIGGRFPLQQWIDRRLGGELHSTVDNLNKCEIALIGAAGDANSEGEEAAAFFQGLSEESFSKEEENLRDSIFDFLAGWQKGIQKAKLCELSADARVQTCARALLPAAVPLADWMEKRIGGEIEIHQDENGNDVIHVTPEAVKIVVEKMKSRGAAPPGNSAQQFPFPPPPPPPPPEGHTGQPKGTGPGFTAKGAKGGGKQPPPSKEAFLESLPGDELTGDEVALREALLFWIESWRPGSGKGKGGSATPLLTDVALNPQILKLRQKLLPTTVTLQEWVEARIGGEIEIRSNQKGQLEILLRSPAEGAEPEPAQDASAILDELPQDALTDEELELREKVLELVSSSPMPLRHVSHTPKVLAVKRKFLPDEVPLRDWIDRRIGGEVEVTEDEQVRSRNAAEEEEPPPEESPPRNMAKGKGKGKAGKAKAQNGDIAPDHKRTAESFFQSLPVETLTDGEEELRDAILTFMEHWTGEDRPPLSKAMLDPTIKRCRQTLPPTLALKDWIERRLSGELEILQNAKGTMLLGVRGDPGPEPTKRSLDEAAEWETGPGKARRLDS